MLIGLAITALFLLVFPLAALALFVAHSDRKVEKRIERYLAPPRGPTDELGRLSHD